MTIRLSMGRFAGTARTLVAVGTPRLATMFAAVRAAAPRSLLTSASAGGADAAPLACGWAAGLAGGAGAGAGSTAGGAAAVGAAGVGAAGVGAGAHVSTGCGPVPFPLPRKGR